MPRIDPLKLLSCLKVLLSDSGGIRSEKEVVRIAGLMGKYSKKLVSKCIYVQILKCTNTELLEQFMSAEGWNLVHIWLCDAIRCDNWPLVQEILELLLLCPVDVERLKSNTAPKLVKNLSQEGGTEVIKYLANRLVEQWLKIVKQATSVPIAPTASLVVPTTTATLPKPTEPTTSKNSTEDPIHIKESDEEEEGEEEEEEDSSDTSDPLDPLAISEPVDEDSQPTEAQKKASESGMVYKIVLKDGKQVLTKVDVTQKAETKESSEEPKAKEDPKPKRGEAKSTKNIEPKVVKKVEPKVVRKAEPKAAKKVESKVSKKVEEPKVIKEEDIKKEEQNVQSKEDTKKDETKSVLKDVSNKDTKNEETDEIKSEELSNKVVKKEEQKTIKKESSKLSEEKEELVKSSDVKEEAEVDKPGTTSESLKDTEKSKSSSHKSSSHKSSSSRSSSSSKSSKTSSSSRHSSDKSKEKEKSSSHKSSSSSKSGSSSSSSSSKDRHREKDRSSSSSSSNKDKSKDKTTSSSSITDSKCKILEKLARIPKISKEPESSSNHTSITIPSKKASMSIEIRKDVDKSKTVKTYKSQFRSHGLTEEAPPPPSRKGLKKPTAIALPGTAIPSSVLSLKRSSPPPLGKESPSEKRAKIDIISSPTHLPAGADKPGAIKLIAPKPKQYDSSFTCVCVCCRGGEKLGITF